MVLFYGFLNAILLCSKIVYFNENLHCCYGRRHDITCSQRKCYVTCGHHIIYELTLFICVLGQCVIKTADEHKEHCAVLVIYWLR